jgi:DNA-directed RNA polymerase specialized sigma24 family protein
MSSEGSVSRWLGPLRKGDPAAVEQLWQRYFHRLVGLARGRLRTAARRAADEEDVALSAFDSFCRNAEKGNFPNLTDRDSLWRLLAVIVGRKAAHLARDEGRLKRGGGTGPVEDEGETLARLLSREPTPELAAQLAEECQRLLGVLADPELEKVALWRMQGSTVEEIAERLGCAGRSVKRKLQLIRSLWEEQGLGGAP